ncbi:MAG TPA: hypothetical protein VFG89_02910 [Coriobacteriia bacterium]|nr:hypothetical protein [Coriobacteriia bacterium]
MSDPVLYSEDMEDVSLETSVEERAAEASVPPPDRMKRIYRVLSILAPLSIAVALAVNWVSAPDAREVLPSPAGVGNAGVPGIEEIKLEKPAIQLLPERIIGYEAISHQAIPGWGKRAAEAVYKTLSMNVEAQIAIVTYGRVEGYASQAEAQARLVQFMTPYTTNVKKKPVGSGRTVATYGESPDRGTRIAGWVRGKYVTIVKSSFQDYIPKREVAFTYRNFQNDQVIDGMIVYQETGREGINK